MEEATQVDCESLDDALWAMCVADARVKLFDRAHQSTLLQDAHELSLLYAYVLRTKPRGGREALPTYRDLRGMSLDETTTRDIYDYIMWELTPDSAREEAEWEVYAEWGEEEDHPGVYSSPRDNEDRPAADAGVYNAPVPPCEPIPSENDTAGYVETRPSAKRRRGKIRGPKD